MKKPSGDQKILTRLSDLVGALTRIAQLVEDTDTPSTTRLSEIRRACQAVGIVAEVSTRRKRSGG